MTDKEKLLECAKNAGIAVGDYTIARVYDYQKVQLFFKLLGDSVHLGMDMASLTCSGDVKIHPLDDGTIRLVARDNGSDDDFKFKGMLLLNSQISDPNSSPEIFFESDYDEQWHNLYAKDGFKYLDFDDGRYLILQDVNFGHYIYKKDDIEQYLDDEEEAYYNGKEPFTKCRRITKNTYGEMLAYINVQECMKRHEGDMILYRGKKLTCDQLANVFADRYSID